MAKEHGSKPAVAIPLGPEAIWKCAALFYVIACAVTWLIWLPLVLGPKGLKIMPYDLPFPVVVSLGTLGPLIACFITHRRQTGNWRAVHVFPRRPRLWVWLLLGPLLVLFCRCFVFGALITKGGPAAWRWHVSALAGLWLPMLNYNLFGGPLFEEFGWRGFLQENLQRVLPPWVAAICVGAMWTFWHLPLFLLGWGGVSIFLYLLTLIGLSAIMAFSFNASGRAVAVAILMHSAFNAVNRFVPAFFGNLATREHPSEGILIALSFLLVAVAVALLTRGRMGLPEITGSTSESGKLGTALYIATILVVVGSSGEVAVKGPAPMTFNQWQNALKSDDAAESYVLPRAGYVLVGLANRDAATAADIVESPNAVLPRDGTSPTLSSQVTSMMWPRLPTGRAQGTEYQVPSSRPYSSPVVYWE